MLDDRRVKHKGLRSLPRGNTSGVRNDQVKRIWRILNALEAAVHPAELNLPGWRLHELKGGRKGVWSVSVSGNWRVTFRWDDTGPKDIDLVDLS